VGRRAAISGLVVFIFIFIFKKGLNRDVKGLDTFIIWTHEELGAVVERWQ
jgi:hypothetical protein